jgi:hypothetical protein
MSFKEDKEKAELERTRGNNTAVYQQWLKKNPQVKDCEATRNILNQYLDNTDELTLADFDFVHSKIGSRLAHQHVPTVEEINAERRAMSVSELRELSRQENPAPTVPELPLTYTPIGKKKEVQLTADVLRRAGTRTGELSTNDLKFLIRRFGASEVNKRLGIKPTVQPGYSVNMESFSRGEK